MVMISNKNRETRRGRPPKMAKNIERLYKEGKCTECSVVVTRMDFAKILGKFTKVKIQYESSTTLRSKRNNQLSSPNSRLKSNENGMVLIRRNAYNQHPVKDLIKSKANDKANSRLNNNVLKENSNVYDHELNTNVLKQNNKLNKTPGDKFSYAKLNLKSYGIFFEKPDTQNESDSKSKLSLAEILPIINNTILPSEEWCIDYLPKKGEPKEDKVYDRIAAELEDLMNSNGSAKSELKSERDTNKDDFPSIMDILNENTADSTQINNESISNELQSNLESSDVEAMLLGKSNESVPESDTAPMEVDSSDVVNNLMDTVPLNPTEETKLSDDKSKGNCDEMDNPHSPSILDEALQTGIEQHLPISCPVTETSSQDKNTDLENTEEKDSEDKEKNKPVIDLNTITHVVFKRLTDEKCYKSVTCPRNLKYSIELEGKSVEFLGAPKIISSIEDLRVLLEIVNESELDSLYVLHN